jgi:hypothetical protein
MLYTLSVFITGIYMGQEYDMIPSIRLLFMNLLFYLRGLQHINNQQVNQQVIENAPIWFDYIRRYII